MDNDKQLIYEQYLAVTEDTRQKPVIDRHGDKHWYINGEHHREDGPAIEYADGNKAWYINGKLHREDGPAIEWDNDTNFWYINGKYYDSIPEWTIALFAYKGWTPELLASKGKDYDKLVNIYIQKMIDKYE